MAYKKKEKADPAVVPNITDPASRATIRNQISEICVAMQAIEDQRSAIKDIVDRMKDTFSLPPKHVRRVARARFKNEAAAVKGEYSEFEQLYGSLYGGEIFAEGGEDDEDAA